MMSVKQIIHVLHIEAHAGTIASTNGFQPDQCIDSSFVFTRRTLDELRASLRRDDTQADIILLTASESPSLETMLAECRQAFPDLPIVVVSSPHTFDGVQQALTSTMIESICLDEPDCDSLFRGLQITLTRHEVQQQAALVTELRSYESSFRDLIIHNADGMVVVDDAGRIAYANPAAAELFGRSQDDLLHNVFGFPVIAGETTRIDIVRPDSDARTAEIRVVDVTWEGEPCLLASLRDVTDRERATVRIEELQSLLAGIMQSALDGIMAFKAVRDQDNQIIDLEWQLTNAAAERMVGYTHSELFGKRLLDVMPGNRDEGLFDRYVAVIESGESAEFEHYYEHERVSAWFRTVGVPLDDGIAITFSDITARKQAEEALRESEQLYRTLAREMPRTAAMIFNRDLCFLVAEGEALAYQDLLREDIEQHTLHDVFPPAMTARLEPLYRAALAGNPGSLEHRTRDRQFVTQIVPVANEDGTIFAGLALTQDVTDHKRAAETQAEARAMAARIRQRERELQQLESMAHRPRPSTPSDSDATEPTAYTQVEHKDTLVAEYEKILELALEQRAYKVRHDVSDDLRRIAEHLGQLRAGPRDVVDIHLTSLRNKSSSTNPVRSQAYAEEGRLVALELMGYLVGYYRSQAMVAAPPDMGADPPSNPEPNRRGRPNT